MERKTTNHRWNKLKQRLAGIIATELDVSFNHTPVHKRTQYSEIVLRFFHVKLDGEIIWRFPKDSEQPSENINGFLYGTCDIEYPKHSIIKYLDLPTDQLIHYEDEIGLADILKVCDRRIGYNRLKNIELSPTAKKIFDIRFKGKENLKS